MADDFTVDSSGAPLNAQYTQQIWKYVGAPVGGEGIDPDSDPVLKYLLDNGLLSQTKGDSEGGDQKYDFGVNAPKSLAGYGSNNTAASTSEFTHVTGDQKLAYAGATVDTDLWGKVTPFANVIPEDHGIGSKMLQYGPEIVGAFATVMSGGAAAPWWFSMMEAAAKYEVGSQTPGSGVDPNTGKAGLDYTGLTQGGKAITTLGGNPATPPPVAGASATPGAPTNQAALSPKAQMLIQLFQGLGGTHG